ncbi:MAG TPA: hypothetical protein VL625_13290 [Patescibacteria group bacterium]|nr:hypothetical protein [Patescibacteria group bacterium]
MKKLSDLYNRCAQGLREFRSAARDFKNAVYETQPIKGMRAAYNNAAFKAVRTYAWPFRIWQAVKAQKYVIPVIIAHQLIQTPTVLLFPKGEDYLKDKGINGAVAQELSDRTIRVRERDLLGTLHSINDLPTVIGWLQGTEMLLEPVQAYAHPDLATRLMNQCPVTMPPKDVTARAALAALANLSDTETAQMENVPMTDEQARMAIAFHEFSHCSTVNTKVDPAAYGGDSMKALQAVPNHAESDADARGFTVAAREFKNPEIPRAFMYARALNKNVEGHDTSLYLDAILRGEKPPRELDALQATQDVFDQLDIYQRMHKTADDTADIILNIPLDGGDADLSDLSSLLAPKNHKIGEAIAMEHLVKEHPDMFNATSKRRAELFIEAVKYFWPKQYEAAHAKAPASTHVFNMAPQTLQPAPR